MERPTDEQIAMWYPRLFRTALRMTGNADDAADLAQHTFCKALDNWNQFDGKSLPTTWLHSILVNNARDWVRRQSIRNNGYLDDWTLIPADGPYHATDALEKQEQLAHMREAIENMPKTLRPAFVATVLDGYTYQEASEMLNVPAGTIASRVYEARQQLKAEMRQKFPEV